MSAPEKHPAAGSDRSASGDDVVVAFLVCPHDRGALDRETDHLACRHCGRIYPVSDGIPDMAVREADETT